MSSKLNLIHIFIVLLLLSFLTSCGQRIGIFEVQLVPRSTVEAQSDVATEIIPVLAAILGFGERISLVQYVSTACTTADGLGGPPKCKPEEAHGTIVQAFPVSDAEGYFVRPEQIADVFGFAVERLYAVYRPIPGIDPEEYWPTGEYALLFEREINNYPQPVIVYVDGGKIVRLGFSYGVHPEALLSQMSIEQILIPPAGARALSEQLMKGQLALPTEIEIVPEDSEFDLEINVPEDAASPNPDADCQESPLAGLVFGYGGQNRQTLWQIGTCGRLTQLFTHFYVEISPGGDQAIYIRDDDIWIVNLLNGEQRNLTNTPERIEVHPQWWRGQEDLIVFGSWGLTDDLGPIAGYLSLVSADGSDYRILVDQSSDAVPAPQPGGSMIAYDLGDTAWLYHLDVDGSELFDVNLYGMNILKGVKIGSPSWSPDGKKLAWWVRGVFSPPIDGAVALALFDLEERSVELLHPYTPIGTGGWLPTPDWSPDGNWLAVLTLSEAHKVNLLVINASSGEEHSLGSASDPVWHPNSSALVYKDLSDEDVKLVEVGDWERETLDLPPGSLPVGWSRIIQDTAGFGQPSSAGLKPTFGPAIYFAASPEMAGARSVFPYGTPEIFAIWSYHNMRDGLTVRREWYLNGDSWIVREEPWDYVKYGAEGILRDISIYDFNQGLEPGRYQLRLYIDGQEQRLGVGEGFSSALFEISAPLDISPHISPDNSLAAIVEPPGTLVIQNVESQKQRTLLTVDEISSLTWYPDGKYILFSVRDRANQGSGYEPFGFLDELWVVHLETGETYPFQDQFKQVTGTGLHHPYISPDGLYLAAIEGTGWGDACFVSSKLWVKEIGFSDRRLQEVFSYFQYSFTINPAPENGEMYVKRIIGWDSPTLLKVELGWACTGENLDGIYLLDISTMAVEKIGESE